MAGLKLKWDKEWDRFIPWRRRKCKHCGYPLSEKYMYETTASLKKKKVYCCNVCYEFREKQ